MSKYIDADKLKRLIGELKMRAKRNRCDTWRIVPDALEEVEGFITSLEQEQPSLPSNLDETAWEYFVKTYGIDNIAISEDIKKAVKFGAEWMAEQGYTQEGIAHLDDHEVWVNMKNTDIKDGDKVIVQIRKK